MNRLDALRKDYQRLPYGPIRAAANREAVEEADRSERPDSRIYRIAMRGDLAWALAVGDDPAAALPVCAEFFALSEEYPDSLPSGNEVIGVAHIAAYLTQSLPQIPLDQCRALLEQFREMVRRYGLGERVWQMLACYFCMETGDRAGAREHYNTYLHTRRDSYSDCATCEAGNAAEFLLWDGRRDEAERVLRPVLEGQLVCEDQPQGILTMLIHDDLDHGDVKAAGEKARWLARISCRNRSDLDHVGAILRCRAYTGPEQSIPLLEQGVRWSAGMWDQRTLFYFYLGAWVFCTKLAEVRRHAALDLPETFSFCQQTGPYDCGVLAGWFHREATDIGERFDRRNGSKSFARKLERAGQV